MTGVQIEQLLVPFRDAVRRPEVGGEDPDDAPTVGLDGRGLHGPEAGGGGDPSC